MRDLRVGRLFPGGMRNRVVGLPGCALGPRGELVRLVGQRPATRVELEEDRFARLAGEPELTAVCVVAVPLGGDRDARPHVSQLARFHEPDSLEQPGRVLGAAGQ